jgi:hypothetical protein
MDLILLFKEVSGISSKDFVGPEMDLILLFKEVSEGVSND